MARNNNKGKTITKLYSPTENTMVGLSYPLTESSNLLHKHFTGLIKSKNLGIIEIDLTTHHIIWTKEALELLRIPIMDAPQHLQDVLKLLSKQDRSTLLPHFHQILKESSSTSSFKFHIPERNMILNASVLITKPTAEVSRKCIVTLSAKGEPKSNQKKLVNDLDFVRLMDYDALFDEEVVDAQSFDILLENSRKIRSLKLLEENENILSSIEHTLPGLIFVYDVRYNNTLYINKNIEQLLGYSMDELRKMGSNYLVELAHPEDQSNFHLWKREERGVIKENKFRIRSKSGKWIWILSRETPYAYDGNGNITKVVGNAQDITELKTNQLILESSVKGYQDLFNTVEESIYILNPDGSFKDVNSGAISLFGYTREEFIGKRIDLLIAKGHNDISAIRKHLELALKGIPQTFEFWARSKAGRKFLKEVRLRKGTYFGEDVVYASTRDISRQRKVIHELRESEQRFRTLQEASFGGIGLHDHGMILDCNQGLCDLTGYSYRELIGMNGFELIAPSSRKTVIEHVKSGIETTYDVEGIRKDGSIYQVEIHSKNIPYYGRTIRVTEFRDITARKKSEAKILEQNARLQAVSQDLKHKNDQLEEFTQIVSHNLRSPVGNILSLISFLENAKTDEERAEYIEMLRQSSVNTLNTLNELNNVLKIKQNKNIDKQLLSFETCYNNVKTMLTSQIVELNAEIKCDFQETHVVYPAIYLESILLNLFSNALKYASPERRLHVSFKTYREDDHIVLAVEDNGLGINLDKYNHQLFKLRKTFHKHPESRGIGLFMIKNQIDAMGGTISLKSKEGEGSTFFINFPSNANANVLHEEK